MRTLELHPMFNPVPYVTAEFGPDTVHVRRSPAHEDGAWVSLISPTETRPLQAAVAAIDARIDRVVAAKVDGLSQQVAVSARRAKHEAFIAALRMLAADARAEGELKLARAHEMDEFAAAIERGEAEPPPALRRVRISLAEDPEPVAEEADESEKPMLIEALIEDRDEPPHMAEFLDRFSSRYLRSPYFGEALRYAGGMPASDATAEYVAALVRDLEERAAAAAGDDPRREAVA